MRTLAEDCIAEVLSLTTPEDACRLSLVSTTFRSASESDKVWDKFLPSDYKDIISRSAPQPPQFTSKKQLYLWLSHHPLIIDNGTKSFSVEKKSGKRCYMLGARDLAIVWGDTPQYWKWDSLPDSRFGEVAELASVCWLEIKGKMSIKLLSPNTIYTAFFVYKLNSTSYGFEYKPAEVSVGLSSGETKTSTVCLDPLRASEWRYHIRMGPRSIRSWLNQGRARGASRGGRSTVEVENAQEGFHPKLRGDGWMEVKLGDYFIDYDNNNCDEENKELEMSLMEVKAGNWKSGLVVQGIEIRPKLD